MAAGRGGTVPMMSYFSDIYKGQQFDILATGVLAPGMPPCLILWVW